MAAHQRDLSRSDLAYDAAKVLSAHERVADAARRLNVSERHLRNLFTEAVGVPPKQFARLDRVRTVLAGARREQWAQLAAEAGYYDQSHMTAEFRDIMGVPPGAFIAGRLPVAASCG
jgi:AraC-like DNA-binding protein